MTSKTQLQSKIQETEITIENASVGDVLDDGSIVLKKSNGLALLVAPSSTEVECTWSKEFPEVFQKLKEQGFNPSQWFVPNQEQLLLAYNTIRDEFSSTYYWSSTEYNSSFACHWIFASGFAYDACKTNVFCVRAFRWVTY